MSRVSDILNVSPEIILETRRDGLKTSERLFRMSFEFMHWDRVYDCIELYDDCTKTLYALCPICGWVSTGFPCPRDRLKYRSQLASRLAIHVYRKHHLKEHFEVVGSRPVWVRHPLLGWILTTSRILWRCRKCGVRGESIPLMIGHYLNCVEGSGR